MDRLIKLISMVVMLLSIVVASHIDDSKGELTNFKWDKVNFRLKKDCSLDKMPNVSTFNSMF